MANKLVFSTIIASLMVFGSVGFADAVSDDHYLFNMTATVGEANTRTISIDELVYKELDGPNGVDYKFGEDSKLTISQEGKDDKIFNLFLGQGNEIDMDYFRNGEIRDFDIKLKTHGEESKFYKKLNINFDLNEENELFFTDSQVSYLSTFKEIEEEVEQTKKRQVKSVEFTLSHTNGTVIQKYPLEKLVIEEDVIEEDVIEEDVIEEKQPLEIVEFSLKSITETRSGLYLTTFKINATGLTENMSHMQLFYEDTSSFGESYASKANSDGVLVNYMDLDFVKPYPRDITVRIVDSLTGEIVSSTIDVSQDMPQPNIDESYLTFWTFDEDVEITCSIQGETHVELYRDVNFSWFGTKDGSYDMALVGLDDGIYQNDDAKFFEGEVVILENIDKNNDTEMAVQLIELVHEKSKIIFSVESNDDQCSVTPNEVTAIIN